MPLCEVYVLCVHCTVTVSLAARQRQPCVNGDWLCQWEMAIFDRPQNQHPLTDQQKNWYRWLRRRPLWLRQIWCKSVDGGLLDKWVKYNENFSYLYLFFINSPTGQTRRRIFTLDGSNDTDSRNDVPFGGAVNIAPHFRGEIPRKPQFLGCE